MTRKPTEPVVEPLEEDFEPVAIPEEADDPFPSEGEPLDPYPEKDGE